MQFKQRKGNLGYGTGLIVLMFCISFSLYLSDCHTYSSVFLQLVQGSNPTCGLSASAATGTNGAVAGVSEQLTGVFGNLGLLGAGSIVAAVVFPNGYAIFSAIAYFLLGGFFMPVALFNGNAGVPLELRVFLIALFSILNIFAVTEFLSAKRI